MLEFLKEFEPQRHRGHGEKENTRRKGAVVLRGEIPDTHLSPVTCHTSLVKKRQTILSIPII